MATVVAWTAVAGIGTYGTFPGSDQDLRAPQGKVSLGLDGAARSVEVPLDFSGLVPGRAVTRAVAVVDDRRTHLSAVTLSTVVVRSSLLDTDPVDGLQLSVDSCSVVWTADWACPGQRALLVPRGPVRRGTELLAPARGAARAREHLAVTVALPASAGNEFAGLRSELVLTFTGVQGAATP